MSEFTELLDAYTKLKADYDELKAWEVRQDETIRGIKEAAHERMDLIIEGVHYMPEEKAYIVYLQNGMRIGGGIAHVISMEE